MHRAALAYSRPVLDDNEVVRRHAPLVDRCARRIAARSGGLIDPGDLWSAGALGLLEAYRRFDEGREVKFETFAEHRIRGAMMDEVRKMDHLPRRLRAHTDRLGKARKDLEHTLKREPTTEELAHHLGLALEDLASLESVSQPRVSLSEDLKVASLAEPQDEALDGARLVARLSAAIATLNPRLQVLLSLYYVEGFTYREVGQALEVSEARVCQLHGEAIRLLRTQLEIAGATPPT